VSSSLLTDIEISIIQEQTVVQVLQESPETVFVGSDPMFISISSAGPQGPAGSGAEEEMLDLEVDQSVPGVVYIGQAAPGTPASSAGWRIKKITDNGTLVSVDWAGGSAAFSYVWNNRLSYTYGP
jgi:hypothetical protein